MCWIVPSSPNTLKLAFAFTSFGTLQMLPTATKRRLPSPWLTQPPPRITGVPDRGYVKPPRHPHNLLLPVPRRRQLPPSTGRRLHRPHGRRLPRRPGHCPPPAVYRRQGDPCRRPRQERRSLRRHARPPQVLRGAPARCRSGRGRGEGSFLEAPQLGRGGWWWRRRWWRLRVRSLLLRASHTGSDGGTVGSGSLSAWGGDGGAVGGAYLLRKAQRKGTPFEIRGAMRVFGLHSLSFCALQLWLRYKVRLLGSKGFHDGKEVLRGTNIDS